MFKSELINKLTVAVNERKERREAEKIAAYCEKVIDAENVSNALKGYYQSCVVVPQGLNISAVADYIRRYGYNVYVVDTDSKEIIIDWFNVN